jgi:hypothetical protein
MFTEPHGKRSACFANVASATFICSLFSDVVDVSDYTTSNVNMISERRMEKDLEGCGGGLIWVPVPANAWREWHNEKTQLW